MPTYEYACQDCKNRYEVVQSFSDAPLTECENCGGMLKRVFHPVGIVLKGSGFYATDNRSGKTLSAPGKKDDASSSSSSESSGASSGKSSSESSGKKPEKKADASGKKGSKDP
jgi:putative FmdB family regulatory protein